ncbi:MAG: carboxypeptidase regulatory-like domain-containing protein, partial [Bacteroidia bacterium]|nr:carboxypeptidase regulatory-like domain-containing protein [Bacteroidia bacterium]
MSIMRRIWMWILAVGTAGTQAAAQTTVLENLGSAVNSPYDELGPLITPDGKTLYFTRENHPDNVGGIKEGRRNQDIWFSKLQSDGTWSQAQNLRELNTDGAEFITSISPDGTRALFKRGNIIKKTRTGWSAPEPMEIRNFVNTHKDKFSNYFLANDGQTLLMSIQNQKSVGFLDLFVSFLQEDGTWSEPQNLGKTINTFGDEVSPFLASDGVTLYFSSNGLKGGYGDQDVWVSRRLDNSWTNWTTPVNLGPQINTSDYDAYYVIPACGDYAYMVSKKNSMGMMDIFRLPIPPDAKPKPVMLLSGTVKDGAGNPIEDVDIEYSSGGKKLGTGHPDPLTGEYILVLPSGARYTVEAKAKFYQSDKREYDISSISECKFETADFKLELMPTVLRGRVLSAATDKPIMDAELSFRLRDGREQTLSTDAGGNYKITLPGDMKTLSIGVRAQGYKPADEMISISDEERGTEIKRDIKLRLDNQKISGNVINMETQEPIAGIEFTYAKAGGEAQKAVSSASGAYTLTVPAETATYEFNVNAKGYYPLSTKVDVNAGQDATKDLFLKPRPPLLVYGKVLNDKTGEGLEGAKMMWTRIKDGEPGVGKSGSGGDYKLPLPSPNNYKITIKKDGFISIYEKILPLDTVTLFQELEINFRM